jgi:hypothetical protein
VTDGRFALSYCRLHSGCEDTEQAQSQQGALQKRCGSASVYITIPCRIWRSHGIRGAGRLVVARTPRQQSQARGNCDG